MVWSQDSDRVDTTTTGDVPGDNEHPALPIPGIPVHHVRVIRYTLLQKKCTLKPP